MFLDITHYAPKRNGKRGPLRSPGPREASGRPSRKPAVREYMVYFVTIEGLPRIKVGRSGSIKTRLTAYRHGTGDEARCLAQIIVASEEDSRTLESAFISHLRARYERRGREWFLMPERDLLTRISEVVSRAGVPVLEVRGLPGAVEERTDHEEAAQEANLVAVTYHRKRLGMRRS